MKPHLTTESVSQHKGTAGRDASVWRPSPLALWFLAIVIFDAVMLILATGVVSTGNDAAGNGMVDGFRQGFAELTACALALLTFLFLAIRHRGLRIVLIALLVPLTLFSLLLTQ